jgi:hypothetical protein
VEFALIAPLVVLLLFGTVEIPLSMYAANEVDDAAADAARRASIARSDPEADIAIVGDVLRAIDGVPTLEIDRVVVYRATEMGEPPEAACLLSSGPECVLLRPPFTGTCDRGWCPTNRKAGDVVGVVVVARLPRVTGLIPTPRQHVAFSTARIEPDVR